MKKMILSEFTRDNHIHFAERHFEEGHGGKVHIHDFYEIFFLISGHILHDFNGSGYDLHKHHIQLIQPKDAHNLTCPLGRQCHLINIAFDPDLLDNRMRSLLEELLDHNKYLIALDCHPVIFAAIHHYANQIKGSDDPEEKARYLYVLLDNYLMAYNHAKSTAVQHAPRWLLEAVAGIKENKEFITGLKRFVQLSQRSQEHLTREMKKHYGMTPTQFINDLRLSYAADLLTASNMDILNVLYESGFNNAAHFSRQFRKKFNCTPSEYRNANVEIF